MKSPADAVPDTVGKQALYVSTRIASATLFTFGFSMRYEGGRNLPMHGPVLVIANHQSFLDPPAIGFGMPRNLVYLARSTLFKNRAFAAFIRGVNGVPIDQDGVGKEGLKTILGQLNLGKPVLVFPEGTRTPDGDMKELRPGIHLLIKRSPAPILPVAIAGAYDAWPSWRKYPIPSPLFLPPTKRTIAVSVGEPLDPKPFAEMPREEAMAALGAEIARVHARAEKLRRK